MGFAGVIISKEDLCNHNGLPERQTGRSANVREGVRQRKHQSDATDRRVKEASSMGSSYKVEGARDRFVLELGKECHSADFLILAM